MKTKEFTAHTICCEPAIKALSESINAFLTTEKNIEVVSLSHATTTTKNG